MSPSRGFDPAADEYPVELVDDVRIPTVTPTHTLSARLYRPVTEDQVPVLVTLVPYRRDAAAGLMYGPYLRRFAAAGFASMLVEFMGTGSSSGTQRPPFDPDEADDSVAAIEWAAEQSWSTGAVGMWGHSYGAITSMRTATRRPRALKAILPVMGMTDPERDFVHPGGQRGAMASVATWGLLTLMNQLLPPMTGYDGEAEQARWRTRIDDTNPWFVQLLRDSPGADVWRRRAFDPSRIEIPAFFIGGWRDLFCGATMRAYEQATGPKKLVIGPWMHTMPDVAPTEPIDFHSMAVDWWNTWLRGRGDVPKQEPDVVIHVAGAREPWLRVAEWPAPEALPLSAPSRAEGDPTVGALGGLWSMPSDRDGLPLDQHDDDTRSLTATSERLPHALTIVGRPRVTLRAPGELPRRLVVRLTDVDEQGRSTLVCSGIAPTHGAADSSLELEPTAYHFAASHHLRIAISGGDFPRLWPAPSDRTGIVLIGVDLELPVLREGGQPESMPRRVPEPAAETAAESGPTWAITRYPIDAAVEVRLGNTIAGVTEDGVGYCEERTVTGFVGRSSAAYLDGTATYTATLPDGPVVRIESTIRILDASSDASADIWVDDVPFASRSWHVPVSGR